MTVSIHPALEALQDGFLMLDREWRVTYLNAAAERALGVSRDETVGRELWERIPHFASTAAVDALRQVVESGRTCELLLPSSGWEARVCAVRAAPIEGGGVVLQLRSTEEDPRSTWHASLLESIRDGLIAVDSGWQVVYVNRAAEALLRLPRQRAIGASLWTLLAGQPPEVLESLRATMRDGEPRHLVGVRPEGHAFQGQILDLWVLSRSGGGLSILFEDAGERLQREKDFARLAAEAEDANRAKTRFFAAVSHELRTPLNAIIGYLHLLRTQTYGPLPTGAQRAADRAGMCAEHLVRLVDDVLLLTTTEIGRLPVVPVPVTLDHFLVETLNPVRHQAEAKGLQFTLDMGEGVPPVRTDPERLRQLLLALLSNAVKFTNRGEIRVESRTSLAQPPYTGDGERRNAGVPLPWFEIAVVDTGPGIAPEDRERIFAPFEQLGDPSRSDSMKHGTGLGLSLARQLAKLLGGELWADPAAETGATFRLRLPLEIGPRLG